MARRVLAERARTRSIDAQAIARLVEFVMKQPEAPRRLDALWSLHQLGAFSDELSWQLLRDTNAYVRGWVVQLRSEQGLPPGRWEEELVRLAKSDDSPVVRRYCASAVPRAPEDVAWKTIEALAQHSEDATDRNLPLLIWQGLAPRMTNQIDRAFSLAQATHVPLLADLIYWNASRLSDDGLSRVLNLFQTQPVEKQSVMLAGLALATDGKANVRMPASWPGIATNLYTSADRRTRQQAERLGGLFGDRSIHPRLRQVVANQKADLNERQHAFGILRNSQDTASAPVFLALLDDTAMRSAVIPALGRLDAPAVSEALLARFSGFSREDKSAALHTLTSHTSLAVPLLEAVAAKRLPRTDLTAFHIRQLSQLNDPQVTELLARTWGRISSGTKDKQALIARLDKAFTEAPLWAYSEAEGKRHFQTLCASCHQIKGEGNRIGPELTGAGSHGIRYHLENIIDPNAVVGQDYQMIMITPRNGDVISGLLETETAESLTVRTINDRVTIAKKDVAERRLTDQSMMPEGLLEPFGERQQIELLKFLIAN